MKKSQENLKNEISKLPDKTGVYKFLDSKNKILYIGKATSLKNRVKSYFTKNIAEKRSPLIEKMVGEATSLKFEETDSVLEAIILESILIKKIKPPYNTADKDQKSWNSIIITDEDFPRILLVHKRSINSLNLKIKEQFGPFTNSGQIREALKLIRKIFPFRDKCQLDQDRPCFNFQIGLCPGTCINKINKVEYAKIVRHIITFFNGKKKQLIKDLTKEMKPLIKNRNFEEANKIKKSIFALKHIEDIALLKHDLKNYDSSYFRIEAYDIAHLSGTNMVGVMTVISDGEIDKNEYRMFKIKKQNGADDTRALKEVLERRLQHTEWPYPNLIVTDGGLAQINVVENILKEGNLDIPFVSVVKDERHRASRIISQNIISKKFSIDKSREIILANSEAHRFAINFHRKLRNKLPI